MWIYKTKLGTSWIIGKSVDKYYQARGKKKKNRDAEDSAEKCIGLVIAKKKKVWRGLIMPKKETICLKEYISSVPIS